MSKNSKRAIIIFIAVLVLGGLSKIYMKKPELKEAHSIGDVVKLNNQSLKVNSVKTSNGDENNKPMKGNEFVILNLTIENNGDKEMNYNPYNFQVINKNGQVKDRTFTSIDGSEALDNGTLEPGEKITGTIVVQEPIGAKDLKLNYTPNIFKKSGATVNL